MPQRRGFTLAEVLIALVIMGIVTGAIYRLLNTSQRITLAQAEQVSLQSNVRTGSLVVPNELRELNTVLGAGVGPRNDIIAAEPTAITYRAMRGLGLVCQQPVAPVTQLRIATPTWTGLRPPLQDRDSLFLFVDGNPDDDGDDAWVQLGITAVNPSACGAVGAITLTVEPVLPATTIPVVPVNTPVRLFETMRLELYPDAAGEWWLGARSVKVELNPLPMLGPLTNTGFSLGYLDSNGNATADPAAIRSIRVTVRGLTDDAVRAGGSGALGHPEEALVTQVLLRNSIRP
jgi:prepilin-type N-terminal cleavage/methylation domain-containing protein